MFEIGTRKIQQLTTGSFYLNAPMQWVKHHKLNRKSKVRVFIDTEGRLILQPVRGDTA